MNTTDFTNANFTKGIAPPDPDTLATNRAKMDALIARCRKGKVKAIIVPLGVYFRDGSEPTRRVKIKSRLRIETAPEVVKAWHEENMRPGGSLASVAKAHGISHTTVRRHFKELGLNLKNKKAMYGENGAGLRG